MMLDTLTEIIKLPSCSSLSCNVYSGDSFFCPIHVHPELEMILINEGSVNLTVGNNLGSINKHELVLIGQNTPHSFQMNASHNVRNNPKNLISYYIQIRSEIFINQGGTFPEMAYLEQIDKWFKQGAIFKLSEGLIVAYERVYLCEGIHRLVALLSFFDLLKDEQPIRLLSSDYTFKCNNTLKNVISVIHKHALESPTIAEIAGKMHISVSTLSRLLKKNLGMSYIDYLTMLKIDKACQLLQQEELPIILVASKSGFNSLTQFNKNFKEIVKVTPSHYRKHWQGIQGISYLIRGNRWDKGQLV